MNKCTGHPTYVDHCYMCLLISYSKSIVYLGGGYLLRRFSKSHAVFAYVDSFFDYIFGY